MSYSCAAAHKISTDFEGSRGLSAAAELLVCMVTDFSVAAKDRDVKFCMHVGLLSGQVFSSFGELWLAESHGGGSLTSR